MEVAADYAYFYDIAEMTPTSEMIPQPGQDIPQSRQDTPQVDKSRTRIERVFQLSRIKKSVRLLRQVTMQIHCFG